MTNQELVTNIICKHCNIGCNKEEEKENCDAFLDALQVANEKDKQYQEEYIQHFDNS